MNADKRGLELACGNGSFNPNTDVEGFAYLAVIP